MHKVVLATPRHEACVTRPAPTVSARHKDCADCVSPKQVQVPTVMYQRCARVSAVDVFPQEVLLRWSGS